MSESLAVLAQNLLDKGEEHFFYLNKFITDERQRRVMKRKGVFPYNYLTNVKVLQEKMLPPKEMFYNDLTSKHITQEEYEFAGEVWKIFECKCIKHYLEIYLLTDCLLLCDVFENFRKNCLQQYNIDPCYYYSSPHFTLDAFLRFSKITLDLLSDVNKYLFIINGIRGGLSMVSKWHSVANNKYLENYDQKKKSVFILDLDANNLYGRAMQDCMPYKNFKWMQMDQLNYDFIAGLAADGPVGCIVQCKLVYPMALHDIHADYPLAPVKKSIPYSSLSITAKQICDKHNLKKSTHTEKLLATFEDRDNYILHYRNLQLYVSLGMVVTRIYAGIIFDQAPVIKQYIDLIWNKEQRL